MASSAQARLTINIEVHAAIYLFPGAKTAAGSLPAVIIVVGAMFVGP